MDAAVMLFIRAKAFGSAQRIVPRTSSSTTMAVSLARAHEGETADKRVNVMWSSVWQSTAVLGWGLHLHVAGI